MTPKEKQALEQHVQAMVKILYADADKSQSYEFPQAQVEVPIAEASVDRGKVRLRTPMGEPFIGRDYKVVELTLQSKLCGNRLRCASTSRLRLHQINSLCQIET